MKIWGESDDLVYLGGVRGNRKSGWVTDGAAQGDELGAGDRATRIQVGENNACVLVTMRYPGTLGGVWSATVEQREEDILIPWPVHIEVGGRGYSVAVIIDCPDGTPVRLFKKGEPT